MSMGTGGLDWVEFKSSGSGGVEVAVQMRVRDGKHSDNSTGG